MVDLDEQNTPSGKPYKKETSGWGWVFLISLLVVVAGLFLWTQSDSLIPSVLTTQGNESGASMQSVSSSDGSIDRPQPDHQMERNLQNRLHAMESRLLGAVSAREQPQGQDFLASQLAQERQDMLALRQTIGFMLPFSALQERAALGGTFEEERLEALRLAPDQNRIKGILESMQPAPSLEQLRVSFDYLLPDLRQALRQNEARDWKDRLFAALEGLVTVRHMQAPDAQNDSLDSIRQDLAFGQLDQADKKIKELPPNLQPLINAWRTKFEQRLALAQNMKDIKQALIEMITAAPQTQAVLPESEPEPSSLDISDDEASAP
ncbi:MAG: hypothetical protein FWF24_01780 [Alphaproteobacteria bacterium]|nr:hypothetical protein [Alphaproteobacteria bacterium]